MFTLHYVELYPDILQPMLAWFYWKKHYDILLILGQLKNHTYERKWKKNVT